MGLQAKLKYECSPPVLLNLGLYSEGQGGCAEGGVESYLTS